MHVDLSFASRTKAAFCVSLVDFIVSCCIFSAALYLLSGHIISQPELHCAFSPSLITATQQSPQPVAIQKEKKKKEHRTMTKDHGNLALRTKTSGE